MNMKEFYFARGEMERDKRCLFFKRKLLCLGRPGTKPDVCENGFPSFKTQISCLQFYGGFLSFSWTIFCLTLTIRKYVYTSFSFGTWLSNLHV